MRPDYDDTEWRKANGYDYEPDGPPWWAALIGALIGYARQRPRAWQATPKNGPLKKPASLGRRVGRKVRSLLAKM